MKTTSKLAVISLGLSVAGLLLALGQAPARLLLAAPLGFVAPVIGVLALWFIERARGNLRGWGLAVAGMCLGGVTIVLSLGMLVSMLWQEIAREQTRGRQSGPEYIPKTPLPDEPAIDFTSNLPIVVLDTGGQRVTKNTKAFVQATFFDLENGRASFSSRTNYDGFGLLHLRGYSTLRLPKHSFTFEAVDRQTNEIKVSLLGLPPDDDWVLYAPYEDKTMIRDVLAYELARQMGHYAPRTKYVELFIRRPGQPLSMQDYAGVYVLVEKIKRGKDRVNIAKLEGTSGSGPDITGGYLFKRDHRDRDEPRFYSSRGGPYFHVYPKAKDITPEQTAWLSNYLSAFEAALYGEAFADPDHGYAAYLEVDAFIDAHWLIELSRNVDGFRYSAYLTKDRGGKLVTGPPWDWNRSFGNANYQNGWQVQGWYWPRLRSGELCWFVRLREDPEFVRRCNRRWLELRRDVFDPQRIGERIDALAAQLEEAQRRNFQCWPILGRQVTCNYYVGDSYAAEVLWLKRWIAGRIAWIDRQVGVAPGDGSNVER